MSYYDHICIYCNRYGDDHSPMCYNWIPPWERKEESIIRGLDWQQQVEAERINVRKKLSQVLNEIDKLKVKVDRGTKDTYTII